MTVEALPQSFQPSRMRLWYDARDFRSQSQFNGFEARQFQWGQWRCVFGYESWEQDDADAVLAFLEKHRTDLPFTVYDPARLVPRGAARNSQGVVNNTKVVGAGAAGDINFGSVGTIQNTSGGLDVFSEGQRIKITGASEAANNKTVTTVTVAPTLITVAESLTTEIASSATLMGYQSGREIVTDGWPNSTAIFLPGDLFGFGTAGGVYRITDTITSDGSGNATLKFAQVIAGSLSPEDNDTIVCEQVPFTMVVDRVAIPETTPPALYSWEVELKEYRGAL